MCRLLSESNGLFLLLYRRIEVLINDIKASRRKKPNDPRSQLEEDAKAIAEAHEKVTDCKSIAKYSY